MTERYPEGYQAGDIHEVEPGQKQSLDLHDKSIEELETMLKERGLKFSPDVNEEETQRLEQEIQEIAERESELKSIYTTRGSKETLRTLDDVQSKGERQETLDEIDADLATPVSEIPDDQLISYGNYLIKQMDYARATNQRDLVEKLNERLQVIKDEQKLLEHTDAVDDNVAELKESKKEPRTFGSLQPKIKANQVWPQETSWAEKPSRPARTLGSQIERKERIIPAEEAFDPRNLDNLNEEQVLLALRDARMNPDTATEEVGALEDRYAELRNGRPEGRESVQITPEQELEETEMATTALKEALVPEDATPEEAAAIETAVEKSKFEIFKEKVMGISIKEHLKNMAAGATVGVAVKASLRASFNIGGLGLSIAGGAIAAPARKMIGAGLKNMEYRSASELLRTEEAEKILDRVKDGSLFGQRAFGFNKMNKLDALKLIADRKRELEDAGMSGDPYQKILSIEQKLIENKEGIEKLSGYDRLQKYIELANKAEGTDEEVAQRKAEIDTIQSDLEYATGRKFTSTQLLKSALMGAVGGAIGYTAAHYIGGLFEHHEAPMPHSTSAAHAAEALSKANEIATKLVPKNSHFTTPEFAAHPAPHQFGYTENNTPVEAQGAGSEETLKVKGTVWGTLKEYFKSKGINATNDQLNEASRYIAHENHIGIAADHPTAGSYEVLDTKIPDGTVLHGIDKLGDIHNLPHAIPEHGVDIPPTEIALHLPPQEISPLELSKELGVDQGVFNTAEPDTTTVHEAFNWLADASEVGPHGEVGLAIEHMQPTGDEMNMTISEFLAHRLNDSLPSPHLDPMVIPGVHLAPIEIPHIAPFHPDVSDTSSPDVHMPETSDITHFKPEITPSHPDFGITPPHESPLPTSHGPTNIDFINRPSLTKSPFGDSESLVPFNTEAYTPNKADETQILKLVMEGVGLGTLGILGGGAAFGTKKGIEAIKTKQAKEKALLEAATTPEKVKNLPKNLWTKKILDMIIPVKGTSEVAKSQRESALSSKNAALVKSFLQKKRYKEVFDVLETAWPEASQQRRKNLLTVTDFIGTANSTAGMEALSFKNWVRDYAVEETNGSNQSSL